MTDAAIAATSALTGLILAPLPAADVEGTLAAGGLFALALDQVNRPAFARLGIR